MYMYISHKIPCWSKAQISFFRKNLQKGKKLNLPVGQFITLYNTNIHKILSVQNH